MVKTMKVTVCELRNDADGLHQDWKGFNLLFSRFPLFLFLWFLKLLK